MKKKIFIIIYFIFAFAKSSFAYDSNPEIFIAEIVILTLPAFKGNEWTVSYLKGKGYMVSYSVQALSNKDALKLAQNKNII